MREQNDWRLSNQKQYLKGVVLACHTYAPSNPENDHDHREFCCVEFMSGENPDTRAAGYATKDWSYWICKTCFDDLVDLFEWKVVGD